MRRFGFGAAVVVVLVAVAVTVVIGMVRTGAAPIESVSITESPGPSESVVPSAQATLLSVHVAGRVRAPGLYILDPGTRVVDAIAAAGGFADDAEQGAVNLARPLTDGEQVMVPAVGAAPVTAPAGTNGQGVLNLNQADASDLEELPRIGPALAGRIIDWREQNGAFTSVDDLLAVPGIGEKMLEGLRELVTV